MSDCLIDKHLYIYKMKTYMYIKNLLEKNDVFYLFFFSQKPYLEIHIYPINHYNLAFNTIHYKTYVIIDKFYLL